MKKTNKTKTNKQQQPDSGTHDTSFHYPRVYQDTLPPPHKKKDLIKNNTEKVETSFSPL